MARADDADPLGRFLARHPWPEAMLRAGQSPLDFLWRFEVDAPLEVMWPLICDTSRLNRAMRLPEMHYQEHAGQLHGQTTYAGFRHVWVEPPWEWVHGRVGVAVREYSRGFARQMRGIFEVGEVRSSGFDLWVYFGWIPRGWLGRKMLSSGFPSLQRAYGRVLGKLAASAKLGQTAPVYRVRHAGLDVEGEAQLTAKLRALLDAGQPATLVERVAEHLRTADELELARIQLKPLARRWDIDLRELLRLSLHAVRVGLFDLSWDIVCPHCRGTREQLPSLSRIPGASRCDACELDFDTRAETSVEVTFRVHPSVRKVEQRHWCAAEPARQEHILVQLSLAPDERRSVELHASEGLYRLRGEGPGPIHRLELREGATRSPAQWTPSSGPVGPLDPNLHLELHNDTDAPRRFVLERAQWSDEALRPGDLLSLREFRDLFSADYLPAEVQLAVGMQTILFSDMVGSTRFYATRGDAEAFVQVRQHFAEIFEIVGKHDGVIVKTIGDAVMAAFIDAAAAIRAAHAIQARFPERREDLDIRVRISINRGPCIAVRFNTEVDYFGSAVNLAAKLQSSAGAGQVVFTTSVHEAPGVVATLTALGVAVEPLDVEIPALGQEIAARRWSSR